MYLLRDTSMKAIKAVLATVTVWHVAGKVNIAKCNFTRKFVKNAIGQAEFDNVVLVNSFATVEASINWFAICGSLIMAVVIGLLVALLGFAVAESHGSMFFIGMVTFAVIVITGLVMADVDLVNCEIA